MNNDTFRLAILNSHPIQYFAPLYRQIAQHPQFDLTVYYCSRQGLEEYEDQGFGQRFRWDVPLLEGYSSVFLPNIRSEDRVRGFFSLINPTVCSELRHRHYDAIWIHGHSYATHMAAILAGKAFATPVLYRCETHLLLKRPAWKRILRRPTMTLLYGLCDACLAIGSRNARYYTYHRVPTHKLFTVPYTVNNDFFIKATEIHRNNAQQIKAELGVEPGRPVILYTSKLLQRKRPMDLLRAYHQVRLQGIAAALVIVGSGEEEGRLREYSRLHNLKDVHFLGFQNQSVLPKIYAISDIFCLPSEDEPWGLIINEVMCARLPVVATHEIGAVADLVHHGKNGLLFQVGDITSLSRHLALLCREEHLREQMGAHSQQIITQWSYDQCIDGIRQALNYLRGWKKASPGALAGKNTPQ